MSVSEMMSPGTRAFWDRSFAGRLSLFEALRARPAIEFHAEVTGPGFWSVVGYDDVVAVSRNPQLFSSAQGFTIDDVPAEIREFAMSMIAMDDPRHRSLRSIVQSAFTAASVRSITDRIRGHARRIAAELPRGEVFDFVDRVAGRLPVQVICELLGIPEPDRPRIVDLAGEVILGVEGLLVGFEPGPGPFEQHAEFDVGVGGAEVFDDLLPAAHVAGDLHGRGPDLVRTFLTNTTRRA